MNGVLRSPDSHLEKIRSADAKPSKRLTTLESES